MESYHQPHHHYMRPPPPPPPQPQAPPSMAADPHFPHHNQAPPPPPPANSWYSGQFQYHPSHSPSPPPPPQQQNQWGPPPPPPPYSGHSHQPFPAQAYPPPPPPPPRPSQAPPLPPYQHQDWTNANWNHHAGWEYPAHANEEDWEAKARAWASARSAMESQPQQAQFTSVVRQEEPSHYANQYAQPVESHYQDAQQASYPSSGYQNYQGSAAPINRQPTVHQQEPASFSSYAPDVHLSYATKDGALGGDMSAAFPRHQGSTSSFVHQQEVPSSYSSVPGKEDGSQGQQHGHPLLPADGRSVPMDHTRFAYGNHAMDPMDQPLSFAPRYNHESDSKMQSGYPDSSGPVRGTDSFTAVPSLHAWSAPVTPGISYPPITPAFPSASQHDPSIGIPPLPGHPAPMFGRGPSFQPTVPSITSPVGLGAGGSLHSTAAFPIDAYGASLSSDRPKKAAVPNWLREEIIKNKATITSSAPKPFKEESQSNEDEIIDKSTAKGDQADSKSMDSAKSAEEEDEDYEEVQKTAAINQEIKRVLTEVLLKVTDELFDEIATKVLSEDDLAADALARPENHVPILKTSPPRPTVPALKASAKVLIPVKAKASEGLVSGDSSSGTPGDGNVLGLANYSSDDEDEYQTSSMSKSDKVAGENGHRQPELEDYRKHVAASEGDRSNGNHDFPASKLNKEVQQSSSRSSVSVGRKGDGVVADEQSIVKSESANLIDSGRKATLSGPDVLTEKEYVRNSAKDDTQERDAKRRDRHESKRSSSGKESYKEKEVGKEREAGKEETRGRRDPKRQKKDKTEDYNISRERSKEKDDKHTEKTRESDSRRSPHHEDKDGKKERERDRKRSGKDDADKKKERTKDDKGDKSRHKSSSDASRHKRRRSSSVGRGRKNEESGVASDGSDDDASNDSKRKVHSKRRNLSPSPVRSKRRQVSRSPHSKHSQRRHSPYPSLDDSRGRRSRSRSRSKSKSRSPIRRRR
ncbi:pre-mRNA-splicing factor CWC22 homolog isoform X1 [Chenopodium quinoa]|uniref:pre-mRNA-splicing factor CWC22 homolog isoform X1 n=1 Tax=Chenopodium quinoa TaxID=63459 RepID=UPI000B776425|nr:pre-mRNA-splicing factor CWC22 homolog isoform X1 [Chenopodium quinoa]